jgi:hypothetical protein
VKATFSGGVLLAVLLGTNFPPATHAQTLTLVPTVLQRTVFNNLVSFDSHHGNYIGPRFSAESDAAGPFVASDTESTPADDFYVSASNTASQDSTITATDDSLSIVGQLAITCSCTAVQTQNGEGSAIWPGIQADLHCGFVFALPFSYSLKATTQLNASMLDTACTAMVGISDAGVETTSLPNLVAYGSVMFPGGTDHAALSGGTSTGILPAGRYYFIARVHSATTVEPKDSPVTEAFAASFVLTATAVPPQPPAIVALKSTGAGNFDLVWKAFQPGNYRVQTSADLGAWSELLPAAPRASGLNTNAVGTVAVPGAGFYRIEYLP